MAEPTPNPTPNPTPPADPTPPTPATGDEGKAIEDAVAKAKAEWEKDLEQKLMDAENEGARKAKLSADQRKRKRTTRQERILKKKRRSLNVKNRCICRNGTCQSRIVCRDCKVHHSRGQG